MEDILYQIYESLPRQGPGSRQATRQAAELLKNVPIDPLILDLGCGSGMQTFELSRFFGGTVYALDNHKPFLKRIEEKARELSMEAKLKCIHGDMHYPSFQDEKFDIIWAEGSIYNLGVEKGLRIYKPFLTDRGYFAFSEVSWLKDDLPEELIKFWDEEYPDMKTLKNNLELIENSGYSLVDSFILPDSAWWDDFYLPLEKIIVKMMTTFRHDKNVLTLLNPLQREIDIFRKFSDYYGYVFYVLQKQNAYK
jgi:ubiquinone/menaquinone biosynthesis C-methylase UbiE